LATQLLQCHCVVPAIAEVIGVNEGQFIVVIEVKVAEPHRRGVECLLKIVRYVLVEQVWIAIAQSANLELMEMRIGPAHGRLQDVVKLGERGVERHNETAPDWRLYSIERHMDLDSVRPLPNRAWRCGSLSQGASPASFLAAIMHRSAPASNAHSVGVGPQSSAAHWSRNGRDGHLRPYCHCLRYGWSTASDERPAAAPTTGNFPLQRRPLPAPLRSRRSAAEPAIDSRRFCLGFALCLSAPCSKLSREPLLGTENSLH
jgi:hypothetical protein